MVATNGNDTLFGTINPDTIDGLDGNDTIFGFLAKDVLIGNAGNDVLNGGLDADDLQGGTGTDQARYADAISAVWVDLDAGVGLAGEAAGDTYSSIEKIGGSDFNDTLTGDGGRNVILGRDGDDTLSGLGGNDRFQGGRGADQIMGGSGNDRAVYIKSKVGVDVNLATGFGQFGDAEGDRLSSIERLLGSNFDDTLTGNWDNNVLDGAGGVDQLFGGEGNDTLIGSLRGDTIDGGAGFDFASYETAIANVVVSTRTPQFLGPDAFGDVLISIEGLIGSDFNDTLILGDGDNIIIGGRGGDFLDGGKGRDRLEGGPGADMLNGSTGIDRAYYGNSDEAVSISNDPSFGQGVGGEAQGDVLSAIENLTGSQHDDTIVGNILKNSLIGLGGNDTIIGGANDDTLMGDAGVDSLTGGTGADIFSFRALTHFTTQTFTSGETIVPFSGSTADEVTDFEIGIDALRFSDDFTASTLDSTGAVAGLSLASATDTVFTHVGDDVFYVFFADASDFASGTVTVAHIATLTGAGGLTIDDFILA
ncbi:MAG: calcium-binding protein [Pseudomonadota bacterium]